MSRQSRHGFFLNDVNWDFAYKMQCFVGKLMPHLPTSSCVSRYTISDVNGRDILIAVTWNNIMTLYTTEGVGALEGFLNYLSVLIE